MHCNPLCFTIPTDRQPKQCAVEYHGNCVAEGNKGGGIPGGTMRIPKELSTHCGVAYCVDRVGCVSRGGIMKSLEWLKKLHT